MLPAINRMDNLIVRAALSSERKALEDLQWRASLAWEDYREALLGHPDAIDLPLEQITEGRTLVAERSGQIVGFTVVLPRHDGNAELDALFVEPNVWRRGIGRRLLDEARKLVAEAGATALYVVANPRAKNFYRACGFVLTGETQTRFGPGLLMRRDCDAIW